MGLTKTPRPSHKPKRARQRAKNTTTLAERQRKTKQNERKRTEYLTDEHGKLRIFRVIKNMNKDYYSIFDIEDQLEDYIDEMTAVDEHVSHLIIMECF
jgi:hypothetical protein